jgi:hypothetical protein
MISNETAAGLIAGMMQGRIHIGPAWDSLPKESIIALVNRWARAIGQDKERAVKTILADIKAHPRLGDAWELCGPAMQDQLSELMRVIIRDT